jgi:4-amino-4-deoxy-L-arabinose transferase-like glycosyltransferase
MNPKTPWRNAPLLPEASAAAGLAVFAGLFAALLLSHWTLLRLPYYWDEAGYYIPAAWDFFRTGSLIPISTLTNAHPPLPSVYLALAWKLFGFSPLTTRVATLAVAALGLTAVWRLALQLTGSRAIAAWTLLLTALYPIWFAQSSLAHADIYAAACTLWGLVYALPSRGKKLWAAALCFAAAALAKETSIAVPLALAAIFLAEGFLTCVSAQHRPRRFNHGKAAPSTALETKCVSNSAQDDKSSQEAGVLQDDGGLTPKGSGWRLLFSAVREAAWLASCVLPLACWYGWHRHKTGFFFGNPEFLRYNAQANLDLARILAAFGHRLLHLTAHMNLFVPVLLALAALLLPRKETAADNLSAVTQRRILLLLLTNALFFSVLGGALLTRYLLPMFPLVLLLAVTTLRRRAPYWQGLAAFSAAAFVAGIFFNPPYGFAPEDNLAYAHMVRLQQAGIAELNARYPDATRGSGGGATVLSSWPLTDALARPELGYLDQPYEVYPLDDFSAAQIAHAAREPEKYSVALVFSTKIDARSPLFTLGGKSRAMDERYFGLHHDLPPAEIARALGGTLVWQKQDQGQWIALIRFNRLFAMRCAGSGCRGTSSASGFREDRPGE